MTQSMPWFRLYSEIVDDRKIKRICKTTGQNKAQVTGVWVLLMALANESPERGKLIAYGETPYTVEDLADEVGISVSEMDALLEEFIKFDMLDSKEALEIKNWVKRQFKSDNVSERVQRHREKQSDETLPKRSNTVIEEEQSRTEEDTEQSRTEGATPEISPTQSALETIIGLPVTDVISLNKIESMNPTFEDIKEAYAWKYANSNGKPFYLSGMIGPIQTAINRRLRKQPEQVPIRTMQENGWNRVIAPKGFGQ